MDGFALWNALTAVATVAATLIALILLRQGQADRRTLRRKDDEEQAALLVAAILQQHTSMGTGTWSLDGSTIFLKNESPRSLVIESITLVERACWQELESRGTDRLTETYLNEFQPAMGTRLLVGGETIEVPLAKASSASGRTFAIIDFRDARNIQWKKRTDTGEFKRARRELNALQNWVQACVNRLPGAGFLWNRLMIKPVIEAAKRRVDRVPVSLTMHRRLWGYWGGGEREMWTEPDEAPPLWPYEELPLPSSTKLAFLRKSQKDRARMVDQGHLSSQTRFPHSRDFNTVWWQSRSGVLYSWDSPEGHELARVQLSEQSPGTGHTNYPTVPDRGTEIEIRLLEVAEPARRNGVGRRLVEAIATMYPNHRLVAISIDDDDESARFWRALQWQRHEHSGNPPGRPMFTLERSPVTTIASPQSTPSQYPPSTHSASASTAGP